MKRNTSTTTRASTRSAAQMPHMDGCATADGSTPTPRLIHTVTVRNRDGALVAHVGNLDRAQMLFTVNRFHDMFPRTQGYALRIDGRWDGGYE